MTKKQAKKTASKIVNIVNGIPHLHVGPVTWNPVTGLVTKNNLELIGSGLSAVYDTFHDTYDWAATYSRAVVGNVK